jgi:hypothetical protein
VPETQTGPVSIRVVFDSGPLGGVLSTARDLKVASR